MNIASILGPLEIGIHYWRSSQCSKMDQARPPFFDPDSPHNIGDWFLTKITDRILDYNELILVPRDASDADWEFVNSFCDVVVLRGGNYIQSRWLADQIGLEAIKKIQIPIVLFGAGVQAVFSDGPIEFDPEEREILERIHASCAFSSARGFRTVEALAQIGIDNVIVTGCPTVFWSREPTISVREPNNGSAGFTFRRGLYSSDPTTYRAQFEAIDLARQNFGSVSVILQGEEVSLQEHHAATRWGAEHRGNLEPIPRSGLQRLDRSPLDVEELRSQVHREYGAWASSDQLDWLLAHTFFSWDIGEYIDHYRSCGAVIGCRLHSNLLALANEVPAFYLTYDERTQEIVDLFDIPGCRLLDFGPHIDVLGQDWRGFETRYEHYYGEMLRFLEANDLRHRLSTRETVAAT
jgi:polysaccharide pyruvyl transferase